MKLTNYFALYMFDTDVAVVPDALADTAQGALAVTFDKELFFSANMSKLNVLQTRNPNTPSKSMPFGLAGEKHPRMVPFIDRSYTLRFDIISARDEAETINHDFDLFRVSFDDGDNPIVISVSCRVDLQRDLASQTAVYEGSITFRAIFEHSNDSNDYVLGSYQVKSDPVGEDQIRNFHAPREYMKTKYKQAHFFSVLRPKTYLFNVSRASLDRDLAINNPVLPAFCQPRTHPVGRHRLQKASQYHHSILAGQHGQEHLL